MKKLLLGVLFVALTSTFVFAQATVDIHWTPPTQNTDGTPFTDGKGYRVYCGTQPLQYSFTFDQMNASATSVRITIPANIGERWYFAATTIDNSNNESAYSTEAQYYFPTPEDKNVPKSPGSLVIKVVVAP